MFDEDGIIDCALAPDKEEDEPNLAIRRRGEPCGGFDEPDALIEPAGEFPSVPGQAAALKEQARAGGLRFEAYLPPDLADWLLALIERGMFTDSSEAAFVMLGEQRELEPHADLRKELLRRSCQASLDDPRPRIPHEEAKEQIRRWLSAPKPPPAVWRSR